MTGGRRDLTDRQLDIIDRLTRPGATQERVAEEMGLATSTVKGHLQAAYRTLGVRSLAQAVRVIRPRLRTPVH